MVEQIPEDETYRRSAQLMEAEINDELVALEPNQGLCFGFNSVATDIWRKLEQPRTFGDLKRELLAEYEVSEEQCTSDLRDLLEQMSEARLIEPVR
ncbi:MAG TPA: PqqD family protein [Sphingomicrobium sp.]|nr:PqqD family protein [Sphingomicrobium sp.]